jgi:hypothetical protein
VYTKFSGDGVLNLGDGMVHTIRIAVKDAYDNTSELSCNVQYNGSPVVAAIRPGKMFYPLMVGVDESDNCEFYIGEKCLYDSVHIKHIVSSSPNPLVVSAVHTIGDTYIPMQDSMTVRIKPLSSIPAEKREKVVVQRFAGSKNEVQKVEWQNDEWASAKFRDFGSFQLMVDEVPPVVVPIGFVNGSNLSKASRIAFTVKDNLGKFKNVKATLDGKWLRFTNDKGRTFIYSFDEKCAKGEHTLFITAEDEAGNTGTGTYRFIR